MSSDPRTADNAVLPPLTPVPGLRKLARIEDLLTPEDRAKLHADLVEMARLRRRAEAEAAWLPMA